MQEIEFIQSGEKTLAIIIRANYSPDHTHFITPETFEQQVGFIVYPSQGIIAAHKHKLIERQIHRTCETLIVRQGKMQVQLYKSDCELIAERILEEGDIIVLINGGHGFRILEDTILLEIKQGPYSGLDEKEHF